MQIEIREQCDESKVQRIHARRDYRQTQTWFECVECGFEENADLVNVLRAGHALLACEVSNIVRSPAARTHRSDLFRLDSGMNAVGIFCL